MGTSFPSWATAAPKGSTYTCDTGTKNGIQLLTLQLFNYIFFNKAATRPNLMAFDMMMSMTVSSEVANLGMLIKK